MLKKIRRTLIIIILLAGTLIFGALGFALTTRGSAWIFKNIPKYLDHASNVDWAQKSGSFIQGLRFKDVLIENIQGFPQPNNLFLQELSVDLNGLTVNDLAIEIFNGKLTLPESTPILLHGKLQNAMLDFNLYTESLLLHEIKTLFPEASLSQMTAEAEAVDIYLKGSLEEPLVEGAFFLISLRKSSFKLAEAPVDFQLKLTQAGKPGTLYGSVTLQKGRLQGPRTALVTLRESQIFFDGHPQNPRFRIKGNSRIENVDIAVTLEGTRNQPDLRVSSSPSLPQPQLLLALATNKTWEDTTDQIRQGAVSADTVKEFIDYFAFAGSGQTLAQRLGFKNISVTYEDQTKGLSVTRELSDHIDATYTIEQTRQEDGPVSTDQKIGGQIRVNDNLSIGASKEIPDPAQQNPAEEPKKQPSEEKVFIEFKKSF
jgi:hypothetical protein